MQAVGQPDRWFMNSQLDSACSLGVRVICGQYKQGLIHWLIAQVRLVFANRGSAEHRYGFQEQPCKKYTEVLKYNKQFQTSDEIPDFKLSLCSECCMLSSG
jgi:hypothetical protein